MSQSMRNVRKTVRKSSMRNTSMRNMVSIMVRSTRRKRNEKKMRRV
jgi:hypothetical protein